MEAQTLTLQASALEQKAQMEVTWTLQLQFPLELAHALALKLVLVFQQDLVTAGLFHHQNFYESSEANRQRQMKAKDFCFTTNLGLLQTQPKSH